MNALNASARGEGRAALSVSPKKGLFPAHGPKGRPDQLDQADQEDETEETVLDHGVATPEKRNA